MAPTIPLDYAGHVESKRFSKTRLGDVMGKTRKVSKGYSSGFVPNYRHEVEAVAESEGFGSSGRIDAELTASENSCAPSRKYPNFNADGYERNVVPIQILSLSKMSALERRDLEVKLKSELDLVKKFQRKIALYTFDAMVRSPTTEVHGYQSGPKRPAMVEALPMSTNDVRRVAGKKNCPGRNGPRTKGGAVGARRNESVKQGLPQNTSLVILMKQCEALLTRLMSHQHAWIFNMPVDIVKHNIPDYFNIIKHPMDLGTIKSKLLSNQYTSPVEFSMDVRLTFKNAMTYNPPGHEVHVMAETLSKYFEVRWKTIDKKIPPTADESMPSKSRVIIEPETAYVPPAKKQKTTMENKVNHERDKQTMSDVEKQKLGEELEASLAELPDNIINFLKESTLNCSQMSEDEIEIDMDALSYDTLFKLRKLLDDYLMEKNKKQAIPEPREVKMQKESGFSNFSDQPCKDDEAADEDVDIGGNDPPLTCSSPPMMIDKTAAQRNSNCSSSRSSSSDSGSSSADTESGSSASEPDGAKNLIFESVNTRVEWKESDPSEPNCADFLNGHAEQNSFSNPSFIEPNCCQEGESARPERQVSPEKQYRAALLRSRFADIIIKAQENTIEKGAEKLKLEREKLERRRREEKARLQAEAKSAEEARKKAEAEAAAEAKRKRELEREAARQALQKMEKTVDINENSHFMEDLEMFRSAPDEHLQSFMDEGSPDNSQNGLGGFKFRASSNPLEQLGLYMKNDDDEEEEAEPQSNPETSDDPEEGEID